MSHIFNRFLDSGKTDYIIGCKSDTNIDEKTGDAK